MIERRSSPRLDLEPRNRRIIVLFTRNVHRKKIAIMMKIQYETVKKVLQKYHEDIRQDTRHDVHA